MTGYELNKIHTAFWCTLRDGRTFNTCMDYFRINKFEHNIRPPENIIKLQSPKHLHERLIIQCRLEGLL